MKKGVEKEGLRKIRRERAHRAAHGAKNGEMKVEKKRRAGMGRVGHVGRRGRRERNRKRGTAWCLSLHLSPSRSLSVDCLSHSPPLLAGEELDDSRALLAAGFVERGCSPAVFRGRVCARGDEDLHRVQGSLTGGDVKGRAVERRKERERERERE